MKQSDLETSCCGGIDDLPIVSGNPFSSCSEIGVVEHAKIVTKKIPSAHEGNGAGDYTINYFGGVLGRDEKGMVVYICARTEIKKGRETGVPESTTAVQRMHIGKYLVLDDENLAGFRNLSQS